MKYTKDVLSVAVGLSKNVAQVLIHLGMRKTGSSHRYIRSRIEHFEIDTSHFESDYSHCIGFRKKLDWEEVLVSHRLMIREATDILRRAFLESGAEEICDDCRIEPIWNGKELRLQIDHVNGDSLDNRKENLRFLCPNCHSQTSTFGVKNIKIQEPRVEPDQKWKPQRQSMRPSKEVLESLVFQKPTVAIAKDFGVSDKAVEKWCKSYGIQKPGRGYWAKLSG